MVKGLGFGGRGGARDENDKGRHTSSYKEPTMLRTYYKVLYIGVRYTRIQLETLCVPPRLINHWTRKRVVRAVCSDNFTNVVIPMYTL